MMREVLERRFARLEKEDPDRQSGDWPDLLLIDGGKGQLSAVCEIWRMPGVHDVPVVGVSKGPDRDAGRESLPPAGRARLTLPPNSPVLFYLQRLRDEAAAGQMEHFATPHPVRPLRDRDHRHVMDARILEHLADRRKLALAAVDQQQVRPLAAAAGPGPPSRAGRSGGRAPRASSRNRRPGRSPGA